MTASISQKPPEPDLVHSGPHTRGPHLLWLLLGGALGLSYLGAIFIETPIGAHAAWKASGIVALGVFALLNRAYLPGFALLASAVGDGLIELPGLFVAGMGAFGIAQLLYMISFLRLLRRQGPAPAGYWLAGAAIAYSIAMLFWLYPAMGPLAGPGVAYLVVISAMLASGLLASAPLPARLGACSFVFSDTLIAAELFVGLQPTPGLIWISYLAAQILLAYGLTRPRGQA